MPNVAKHVEKMRGRWGKPHVDECVRRGLAGEPGWFYAIENGHTVGTPFHADQVTLQVLGLGVALGMRFAIVMKPGSEEARRGAH
jgi:hypothetical protein